MLAGSPIGVAAQDESPAADDGTTVAFDPNTNMEMLAQQEETLIICLWLRQTLLDFGVPEDDVAAAVD